jgi:hypothetical protein
MWKASSWRGPTRGPARSHPRHAPTAYELETLAQNKIAQLERTVVAEIFAQNWRLVSVGHVVVGYTPFRDCSVVLTVFSAGKVLSQLYDYLIEDKPRLLPIPYGELLPRKGKRGIDYFLMTALSDVRALYNYAAYSTDSARDAEILGPILADLKAPLDAMMGNVVTYASTAKGVEADDVLLWPSAYCMHMHSAHIQIFPIATDPESVRQGVAHRDGIPLAEFTHVWPQRSTRGCVEQYKTIYQ